MSKAGLFPNENTSKITTVWTGSSSKLKIDLAALKKADPDALLVDGVTVSLTKKQQKTIRSYGINVVTVPTLSAIDTPDKNITTAVDTVAEMMKKVSGVSTMGSNYDSFRSQVLKNVRTANGGYSVKYENGSYWDVIYQGTSDGQETNSLSSNSKTVVFVDSWTTNVRKSPTAERSYGSAVLDYLNGEKLDASDGVGLSATTSSRNFALMDYYFQIGGVVNNSYDAAKPSSSSGSSLGKSYLIIPGGSSSLVTTTLASDVSERRVPSALWYSPTDVTDTSSWLTVGDDDFPGVLTRTEAYANTIVTSSKNSRGIYNVGQKYNVSVVPQGLAGSWADGTIESFLLSAWVQDKYYDTSNCASYAQQFYKTFYRYSGSTRNLTKKVIKDYSFSKTAGN